jgi:putative addiction module component (TIGR02574 family)
MSIKEIRNLSVTERILMVEAIWDTIEEDTELADMPLTPEQEQELKFRIQRYENGNSRTYTLAELKSMLQRK